ncbi:conserved hypothetical protein [Candidatus Methylobacter favarea]|uniref:S-adenosyl-l-methionine hydroxide adenosyltransferase C-terminal domain-containing protein n=1 Tax=Candidatus Methylobacter favarea TaxID=2707345 RepID=A0A8S0WHG0_9GAMM|nr:conserved hypothetical protein [Candidatus Methylobacter favarea]
MPFTRQDLNEWLLDLPEVIYFDYYGNAMTGLRYQDQFAGRILRVNDRVIRQADTFNGVEEHQAFWYKNSSGLIEIAVNKGNAGQQLDLELGTEVSFKLI